MATKAAEDIPQPTAEPSGALKPTVSTRWYGRLCLLLVGVACLTAAFAPVNQFYLAWVGLVPWLLVLNGTRSQKSAFFWSWLFGTLFFIANMWWMAAVTGPGMVALMAILGLYWGATGIVIRGAGLFGSRAGRKEEGGSRIEERQSKIASGTPSTLNPRSSILDPRSSILDPRSSIFSPLPRLLLTTVIFVALCEWLRGVWPWHGLPWLFLGYTQSPVLWICQIADITGVEGLSFVIVLANVWIAVFLLDRRFRRMVPSGVGIIAVVLGMIGYGAYRFSHEQLTPGPTVLVVQPNFPQSNSGAKGATVQDLIEYHLRATFDARPRDHHVDLVVWSETMMPSMNRYTLDRLRHTLYGHLIETTIEDIGQLCRYAHVAILTGAEEWRRIDFLEDRFDPVDKLNVSCYFTRNGDIADQKYVKIHLVPFGEFIPFKYGLPWFYRILLKFGPPDMDAYNLVRGDERQLTVFPLPTADGQPKWRFVTPICFEDIDADLCAEMFRPDAGAPETKRADFIVNMTNDGWFKANENTQHLQAALFRSIENRVPTARSVNTGISGFVDPLGRTSALLPPRTEGTTLDTLMLDSRVTVFTRTGQLLSWICAGVTLLVTAASFVRWMIYCTKSHSIHRQR